MELSTIDEYAKGIANEVERILHNETMRVYSLGTDIARIATAHISEEQNRISIIRNAIQSRLELIFATENNRLRDIERTLKGYSIDNILKLGFAVARTQDGALRSIKDVTIGSAMDIELLDGVVGAEIKSITPKN